MKVIDITLTGSSYRNGRRIVGYVKATLDNGSSVFLASGDMGFKQAADIADGRGYDTTYYRAKLEQWVKTGKWS